MAYTKAGMKAADKYVRENYDRITIKLPKGRKGTIEAIAKERGESVNGLINSLLRGISGLSDDEWKNTSNDD